MIFGGCSVWQSSINYLEDVAPILSLVVQSLVKHLHNLYEVVPFTEHSAGRRSQTSCVYALVKGHLSDLVHLGSGRTPWVVGCRLPYFRLNIGVPFRVILRHTKGAFPEVLDGHSCRGRMTEWKECAVAVQGRRSDQYNR